MVKRHFWLKRIESAWENRNILWLSGVRRVGKTFLCRSIPGVQYFDCELPRIRAVMEDPQAFLEDVNGSRVVLDEIHRLGNPSELLKISADYFPETKIIATGSSTLGASKKFKDTLSGRKTEIWLTPIMSSDLRDFNRKDLRHRLLHGGLPSFFLADDVPEYDFQEWLDAYWAKDIQELFRLERRYSFQKFFELLLAQSGGIFEATRFSKTCEVSRGTITNYLKVLELTFVVHVVRPFTTRRATEIVAAPKVYGFDTGFVCYYRGWFPLRQQDLGFLWEHYVLNEMFAHLQTRNIHYWRDKRRHEVDFIIKRRGKPPIAIECKWNSDEFEPANLLAFWRQYPNAEMFVVANNIDHSFSRKIQGMTVRFVSLSSLVNILLEKRR